jgi:hypothetical protein
MLKLGFMIQQKSLRISKNDKIRLWILNIWKIFMYINNLFNWMIITIRWNTIKYKK